MNNEFFSSFLEPFLDLIQTFSFQQQWRTNNHNIHTWSLPSARFHPKHKSHDDVQEQQLFLDNRLLLSINLLQDLFHTEYFQLLDKLVLHRTLSYDQFQNRKFPKIIKKRIKVI